MPDEPICELEVVEDAGQEEEPAGEQEGGPPGEEGVTPSAGLVAPSKGRVVERGEGNPEEQAAEREELSRGAVADVCASKARAERGLRDEDDPGKGDDARGAGLAMGETEGKCEE